jgi:hypothetical protein
MRHEFSFPPDSEILAWPRPDRKTILKKHQADFDKRVAALTAVVKGSSVQAAASLHGVDRTTLTQMAQAAPELAEDGKPYGFRVCVPWFRRAVAQPTKIEVPLVAAPHAFTQLVLALEAVRNLLINYQGGLPARHQRCSAFEMLFRQFKKILRDASLDHAFPLNTPDKGRRALQNWIQRRQKHLLDLGMTVDGDDGISATRLEQFFTLKPLDRGEFDAHRTDVDWHAMVPTPDGMWKVVLISTIWLLVLIDVVSLVVYAWMLVVGKGYNQLDQLRTYAKALTPWSPRTLIVPGMRYAPGAWMPGMVDDSGQIRRLVTAAMDNAMAHVAKLATASLGEFQLGVVNLGFANVPEGRPNVEAFFKLIEDRVLRFIAGGFRPPKELEDSKQKVSKLSPTDHPVDLEALEDLLDVIISAYHVTEHLGLQGRTPKEVFQSHVENDGWTTRSSLTASDAIDLLTIRVDVTVRGSKGDKVLPHVNYEGARYRSPKLNARWDLIGTTFKASLPFGDIRAMSLFDDKGDLFVVLRSLPPWAAPHTLEQRRKAIHWRNRGLFEIPESGDALAAYHTCVRANAGKLQWAADLFVKENLGGAANSLPEPRSRPSTFQPVDTLAGLAPRGGYVGLTTRRK